MSQKTPSSMPTQREIYYAARRAADFLPPEEQEPLHALLKRGHKGENVRHQVLDIINKYPKARDWLTQALYLGEGARAYARPPGDLGPIPARSLWVCPQCGFTWRVLRKGRPVPRCPHDGSALVLKEPSNAG